MTTEPIGIVLEPLAEQPELVTVAPRTTEPLDPAVNVIARAEPPAVIEPPEAEATGSEGPDRGAFLRLFSGLRES